MGIGRSRSGVARRVDGSLDATGGSTNRPNRVRPVAGHLPPTRETVDRILREVRRCTRDDIRMNVFMLDTTPHLAWFIEDINRVNGGGHSPLPTRTWVTTCWSTSWNTDGR